MTSVDERVVSIKLKDDNFQRNVDQILKAIQRLKKELKFNDTTKDFAKLDKAVKGVKFDSMVKGASEAQKSVGKMASKAEDDLSKIGSSAEKSFDRVSDAASRVNMSDISDSATEASRSIGKLSSRATEDLGQVGTAAQKSFAQVEDAASRVKVSNISNVIDQAGRSFSSLAQSAANAFAKISSERINLTPAIESVAELKSGVDKFSTEPMQREINAVNQSFNSIRVAGIAALGTLVSKATEAGMQIANQLTAGIRGGLEEYNTQLTSIQTILANTQKEGTNINQVNGALNTLNTYADQTIYNFGEMARNIGTFTAAGVDLQTSVNSIKGIANLAAMSGSSSAQASTAMYQLSQAIAAGKVQLMDWNSVVNAGMGGATFQDALIRTSDHLKSIGRETNSASEAMREYGSFRESLTEGAWLSTQVLTETLKQLSGAYTEADLVAQGYSEKEAKLIVQMADTASKAATQIKTFSQLMDTAQEEVGSGWAQTWQIVFGDFEEARTLWTEVGNAVQNFIGNQSKARNQILTEGLSTGYKQLLAEGIADTNAFSESLQKIAKNSGANINEMISKYGTFEAGIGKTWKVTGDQVKQAVNETADSVNKLSKEELANKGITQDQVDQMNKLRDELNKSSTAADEFANKMNRFSGRENIIQGLRNIVNAIKPFAEAISKAWSEIFPAMTGDQLYDITERFKKFTETLKPSEDTISQVARTFKGFFAVLDIGKQAVTAFLNAVVKTFTGKGMGSFSKGILENTANIGDWIVKLDESIKKMGLFDAVAQTVSSIFSGLGTVIGKVSDGIAKGFTDINSILSGFGKVGEFIGQSITNVLTYIQGAISSVVNGIRNNVDLSDVFAGIASGGIVVIAKKLSGFIDKIKETIDGFLKESKKVSGTFDGIIDTFKANLEQLGVALSAFTNSVKAFTLLEIATAVALLVNSMKKLGDMRPDQIASSVSAIAVVMTELNLSFRSISKTMNKYDTKGIIKVGIALIAFSKAVKILADAMVKIGNLDMGQVGRGLLGIGGAIAEMSIALKVIGSTKTSLKSAVTLLAVAKAVEMIADPLKKLGTMSWQEIGQGLSAMGGALAEISIVTTIMGKFGKGAGSIASAASILIVAQSLGKIADAFGKFGSYDWGAIGRGLVAMGGALSEVAIVVGVLGKLGGFSSLFGAGAIWIVMQGLKDLAAGFGIFGSYDWGTIGRGLVAMGGALAEIGVVSGALGKIAGLSGLIGAGTIWIVIQGLDQLADALATFGKMSWDEIGRGLVAMGGALLEVAGISGALGMIAGIGGLIGAGAIWIAIQGLDQLADGLIKFGSMSWDEIGRGLVAMGGALLVVGGMSGALGMIAGFAGLLGAGSILIAVQGLDQLAVALQKFGSMSWDEIGRGLTAMVGAMGATGLGALLNTFSGIGADNVAKIAGPIGTLADSVAKWQNVTVPPSLGDSLSTLAGGLMKFTFAGLGADALTTAATGVGNMAGAVAKWMNVQVPAGLEQNLTGLANGVKAFTWAFMGGFSISQVTGPLGDLAGTVNKWKSVTIPPDIEQGLTGLANGVKAFSLAFLGGLSLGAIIGPLGDLAGSVAKWKGVSIPDGIDQGLSSLANGVKSFSLAFLGGWSLGAVTGPLGDLAKSVRLWQGVSVPAGLDVSLSGLATAIRNFAGVNQYAEQVGSAASVIQHLGTAVGSLAIVPFVATGTAISTFVTTVNNSGTITSQLPTDLTNFSSQLATSMSGLSNTVASNSGVISAGFNSMRANISGSLAGLGGLVAGQIGQMASAVQSGSGQVSAGLSQISSAASGFAGQMSGALGAVVSVVSGKMAEILNSVNDKRAAFTNAGRDLANALKQGLTQAANGMGDAFRNPLQNAVQTARSYHSNFYNAGAYLVSGFSSGIRDNVQSAANAAAAMAKAASAAANKNLEIKSPSRVMMKTGRFFTLGFAQGITDNESSASAASVKMASDSVRAFNDALSAIAVDDIDLNPTITPVLDLSNVKAGSAEMESLFADTPIATSLNVRRINPITLPTKTDPNANQQNATNAQPQNVYNMTQNNYSPKALNTTTIYRQTRNQFAALKEGMNSR